MNKKTHHSRKLQKIMKLGKIGLVLFAIYLGISSFVVSATLVSDSTLKADTAKAIKVVEILNTPDTIKSEFFNDTINISKPIPIGQIIYTEHKTNLNLFLDYAFPIIMLLLGVVIDRLLLRYTEKKRVEREGLRWKSEMDSLLDPLKRQGETFRNFINEYCNVKNRFDIPYIDSQVLLKCEIFDSLNKEDLYKYVQSLHKNDNIATQEYHKVIQVISVIKSCQNNLSDVISEMKSESNKLINQFNEYTQEYNRKLTVCLDDNLLPLAGTKLQDLYSEKINKQMPNVNILELEDSFVRPSIDILADSKGDRLSRIELRNCLQSMLDIIQGLRNEKKYIQLNLEQLMDEYSKAIDTIASIKLDK
ncbi:hypothetical protein [Odoribacter lunatus]|uniref:hypothetical protein n=1 Tax=Odoribacter lunatus TaxID=2941335 RepID=UPI00203EA66A|nr:hypothetical protein [Odoribacter lunatus]